MPANIHDVERLLGKAALLLRVGPTQADSMFYRPLVALGILERLPATWPLAEEIAHLPWGAEPLETPEPDRPDGIDGAWRRLAAKAVVAARFPGPGAQARARRSRRSRPDERHALPRSDHAAHTGGRWAGPFRIPRQAGPGDRTRWDLAKSFVLQGAQCLLVHIAHPRLHLPLDSLNAITHSLLPAGHRVKRLLGPHFLYTLGLHRALIHHQRGATHNNQREVSLPFTFQTASMHDGFALGVNGLGTDAYPAYNLFGVHLGTHTEYGRYRQAWYRHILDFTRKVVATLEHGDRDVTRWADTAAQWVEGFPDGTEIWRDDVLAETLATIIATVSVFHTADHDSYSRIPIEQMPFRLRQPPPDESGPQKLDVARLTLPEDYYRHYLAHRLYFKPVIRTPLASAKYEFRSAAARSAAAHFLSGMNTLDQTWGPLGYATSDRIATSVQY